MAIPLTRLPIEQMSFTGGEWTESLDARHDLQKYATAVQRMYNMYPHPQGGVSNRAGTHYICALKYVSKKGRLIPFQFSVVQTYMLVFENLKMRIVKDDGLVVDGTNTVVEVTLPYTEADLPKLKYRQTADTLYLTHPSYPPATLTRSSHTAWTYSVITFQAKVNPPTGVTNTAGGGTTYTYAVTSVAESEEESVISSSTCTGARTDTIGWTAPTTGTAPAYYNIYEKKGGMWGFVTRTSGTELSMTLPNNAPDMTVGPPVHDNPFDGADNYPGCSAFFEQRAMWGRTNSQPQNIKGSRTGFFTNMDFSSPLEDDDAIDYNIPSEGVNEILWMIALQDLLIGTKGTEWKLGVGSSDGILSPTSVTLKQQSAYGVCDIPPHIVGAEVLFVDGSRKRVRNLKYSLDIDGYNGDDLTIWAQHLFTNAKFVETAYQRYPDSVLWGVLDDGRLVGFTYLKEQNVAGWHQHQTDGIIESVATLPGTDGSYDDVYIIVKRTINGADTRYVERLDNRQFIDIADAFFVDCGLTYDGSPATVFTGLSHLEGKKVVVFADGNVITGKTVTSGSITLDNAASVVHIGLPYTSQLQTLSFDAQVRAGNMQSRLRSVKSVSVKLQNSRECFIGPSFDALREMKMRSTENYGQPIAPFSGWKPLTIRAPKDKRDASVCVEVRNPVPTTIKSIVAEVCVGALTR